MCTGFTQSFTGLLVCRILLGLCEAGFLPGSLPPPRQDLWHARINLNLGCLYLISMYYRRYEFQKRFTLFFCSTVISGAFGGVSAPMRKNNMEEFIVNSILTLFFYNDSFLRMR